MKTLNDLAACVLLWPKFPVYVTSSTLAKRDDYKLLALTGMFTTSLSLSLCLSSNAATHLVLPLCCAGGGGGELNLPQTLSMLWLSA